MSRSLRRPRAVVTALTAALAVGVLVAGCADRQAGSAAVVGDRRISVDDVQSAYRDVNPLVGQDAQFTQTNILNWLILEPYLVSEAAEQGRGVSTRDASLEWTKIEGATQDPSPAAVAVVRAILARGAIVGDSSTEQMTALMQDLAARLAADGVQISPRFGSGIDATTSAILQQRPDWLVAPETPAP